nr:MAG TPA: hypothetical protein [Caudoviricetes sp.]
MKMLLPFGDWSEDGHCKYDLIEIEAPSMEHLLNAENKIKAKYGKDFFEHFATEYKDASIGDDVIQALFDIDYDFPNKDEYCDYTFKECIEQDNNNFEIEYIQDMFIKLLNAYGAEITVMPKEKRPPMICNWTCKGFKTVGYGCF